MATYRSPFYPSLQVMLDGERAVRFVGGFAEVADADLETFEEWVQSNAGQTARVHRADGLVNKTGDEPRDPADDLGPGYTPAEREAYRMQRAQTAPPPPEDQRTDGQKAANSVPVFPAGFDAREAAEMDPEQASLESANAAHALREEQALADERGADRAEEGAEPAADIGTADTDDGLEDLSKAELQDRLRDAGKPVSGNVPELIARLREED